MRKYLIAGAVAVMVFAFAAFAASLNVTANTLQVGETAEGELECTDGVHVYAWFYNDQTGDVDGVRLALLDDQDEPDTGHTCDGDWIMVTPLAENGTYADSTVATGNRGVKELKDGQAEYVVNFTEPLPAEDIYSVRVGIEQGSHVGSYSQNPR